MRSRPASRRRSRCRASTSARRSRRKRRSETTNGATFAPFWTTSERSDDLRLNSRRQPLSRRRIQPMFAVVLAVVLPVVITVAVGFLWTRYGYPLNSKELTALIADVATPCLIIATFQKSQLSFDAFAAMAGATAAAIVLFAGVGALALRAAGLRIRTFLPSIAFPNAGNLGLPLSLYAFGTEGLGYAIAFFSISSVANYTLGQMIAAGKANWRGAWRCDRHCR